MLQVPYVLILKTAAWDKYWYYLHSTDEQSTEQSRQPCVLSSGSSLPLSFQQHHLSVALLWPNPFPLSFLIDLQLLKENRTFSLPVCDSHLPDSAPHCIARLFSHNNLKMYECIIVLFCWTQFTTVPQGKVSTGMELAINLLNLNPDSPILADIIHMQK